MDTTPRSFRFTKLVAGFFSLIPNLAVAIPGITVTPLELDFGRVGIGVTSVS